MASVPPASPIRVIRNASFQAVPWKNGGGITREAARMPAEGPEFYWRLSLAHVDVPGPFSQYAGYQRTMVLLDGAGVVLSFADGTERVLRRGGDLVSFNGASAPMCRLLDGPCVDLNLMVAEGMPAAARVQVLLEDLDVSVSQQQTLLIVSIDQPLAVRCGAAPALPLEPWDLAVAGECSLTLSPSRRASVFLATLLASETRHGCQSA